MPEFYHCADFLRNDNELPLGCTQGGATVGDTRLPPWSSSAEDFVQQHRAAPHSGCNPGCNPM